ncbi:MAG: hypothetical protein H6Q60_1573 [Oscillospiraceae bacterium]|nr:hypothetical protein [Oscillospiraceae bacterium]
MSYCVNCGVELDETAGVCPLCETQVYHPRYPVNHTASKPFPTNRAEVSMASRREVALLITVMFVSVALCCGLLNLFLRTQRIWSLYIIGAVLTLWVWSVPPLLKNIPLWFRLFLDVIAVGTYVFLIAVDLDGINWFMGLALPILSLLMAVMLFLGISMGGGRSILSGMTLVIGTIGVFLFGVELFIDFWITGAYHPTWSIAVLATSAALVVPLIVVRRVPNLREEARRRFHL